MMTANTPLIPTISTSANNILYRSSNSLRAPLRHHEILRPLLTTPVHPHPSIPLTTPPHRRTSRRMKKRPVHHTVPQIYHLSNLICNRNPTPVWLAPAAPPYLQRLILPSNASCPGGRISQRTSVLPLPNRHPCHFHVRGNHFQTIVTAMT